MKKSIALSLLALVLSASASAHVKQNGTPVAYLCANLDKGGIQAAVVAASQVCLGTIVGTGEEVLMIALNDGVTEVWKTLKENNVGNRGFGKQTFTLDLVFLGRLMENGDFNVPAALRAITFQAKMTTLNGMPIRLQGKTPGNIKFDATGFEHMAQPMGF